jgi:hypothetical protein
MKNNIQLYLTIFLVDEDSLLRLEVQRGKVPVYLERNKNIKNKMVLI